MNILETNVINIEEEYDININYLNENLFSEILKVDNKIAITGFGTGFFGVFLSLNNFFLSHSNLTKILEMVSFGGMGISGMGIAISLFSLIGIRIFNGYKYFKNKKMKKFFDEEFEKPEMKDEREFYQYSTSKICSYFKKYINDNEIENKIINIIDSILNHFSKIDSKENKDIYEHYKKKFSDISKYNILIIGKTGVGKSTLINSVLQLKKNKAKEGDTEKPQKIDGWTKIYPISEEDSDTKGLNLWDTEGIQFSNEENNDIENHQNNINNIIEENKDSPNKQINCIWC